jgi:hypothetical protein
MNFIKYIYTIFFITILGVAYGQHQVPLYAPGNSAGYSSGDVYNMLSVTGQNAIGPTANDSYKAYLGLLGPVRYVLTDAVSLDMSKTKLYQNYPNPFKNSTTIPFEIAHEGKVQLTLYNILGQPVEIIVAQNMAPGKHEVEFNAQNNGSGMYYYQLRVNGYQHTKTMVLAK